MGSLSFASKSGHAAISALLAFGMVVGCQSQTGGPVARQPNVEIDIQKLDLPGLHNLFRVSDRIFSGSSPEGETGFDSLRQLGVRTIVSVDGARPDVELATRLGMEYVHLPIGYDGISRSRVLELAKLAAARPGPFYVHCHHGLHRGPVAVAVMRLCDDRAWTVTTAELWLQKAGTSPQYPGLIHTPRTLRRPAPEELAAVPDNFPATSMDNDLAAVMVEVDAIWDRLKLVKSAGWAAPPSRPDIDPPHEALQLVEQYREAARLPSAGKHGPTMTRLLADAESATRQLEAELRGKPVVAEKAAAAFTRAAAQCATCHNQFRDRPKAR
ncbi:MAG: hypothetical protein K1X57_20485 [Gemmataceae bacterium]|nr:hypothetical protein [Gemmataceae bacterium]